MASHALLAATSASHLTPVALVLAGAFALGLVHGVTPDEHTWPITFSYAAGSFSSRRASRSALAFSLAFTVQRALLCELAYLGLVAVREDAIWNAVVYLLVGAAMLGAGVFVLRLRCTLHLHCWPPRVSVCRHDATAHEWAARTPSPRMAAIHGFLAGFAFGGIDLVVVTVLAPAMPSAALGWAPGALFGLGTGVVLVVAGALIGALVRRRRLPGEVAQRAAQEGAGWTLLGGGALFAVAGIAGIADPALMSAGIATGINVDNLDRVGVGTVLALGVLVLGLVAMGRAASRLREAARSAPAVAAGPLHREAPRAVRPELAAGAEGSAS